MECSFGELTGAYRRGLKFLIDAADYQKYIKGYSFCLDPGGYVMYSSRKDGLTGKYLARVLFGEPDDMDVDHKNLNKLDNRRENLRIATRGQNNCNKTKYKNNTSGFKGVSFHKKAQKYRARISIDGKQKFLGYFVTAEAAHQAYKQAAIQHHGEFARY